LVKRCPYTSKNTKAPRNNKKYKQRIQVQNMEKGYAKSIRFSSNVLTNNENIVISVRLRKKFPSLDSSLNELLDSL
jgi:hypothetical protein